MKKQFVFSSTRKVVTRFALAAALFFNASLAFAGIGKGDEPFVKIQHTGLVENRAQFQVDLVNDADETYLLTIQDHEGTILYKERINAKTFTKRFEWENGDETVGKLIFTVTGLKTKKTYAYEANTEVRTVRDVVISKR